MRVRVRGSKRVKGGSGGGGGRRRELALYKKVCAFFNCSQRCSSAAKCTDRGARRSLGGNEAFQELLRKLRPRRLAVRLRLLLLRLPRLPRLPLQSQYAELQLLLLFRLLLLLLLRLQLLRLLLRRLQD